MKEYHKNPSRTEYFETQIARSRAKFPYCKVSCAHVRAWKRIITEDHRVMENTEGPILCLGTRNGREVDLFRSVFYLNEFTSYIMCLTEIRRYGWDSRFPLIESIGRSSIGQINEDSVIGVEINPDAKRRDVFVGSFDDMPLDWTDTFRILYSNSFDQSQNPHETAREWIRVLKDGGIAILGFSEAEPSPTDPVGNLSYKDFVELFPGELIYYNKYGSNYSDIIIKVTEDESRN